MWLWRHDPTAPGGFVIVREPVDINGTLDPALCAPGSAGSTRGGGPPTVADFDGDGVPDVALAGGVGYAILNGAKLVDPAVAGPDTFLWVKQTRDCSSAATGSSTTARRATCCSRHATPRERISVHPLEARSWVPRAPPRRSTPRSRRSWFCRSPRPRPASSMGRRPPTRPWLSRTRCTSAARTTTPPRPSRPSAACRSDPDPTGGAPRTARILRPALTNTEGTFPRGFGAQMGRGRASESGASETRARACTRDFTTVHLLEHGVRRSSPPQQRVSEPQT